MNRDVLLRQGASASDGIHVVFVPGRGICPKCGNGLWPNTPPCEHRIAAAKQAEEGS